MDAWQKVERQGADLGRRNIPQQSRSKATVQSIFQATLKIARAEGFASLGTRRIAEVAGVSAGTLYQYFPTVEAILLTIYEETASRVINDFRAEMLSVMHAPMEVVADKTLQLLLRGYEENRLILHRMVMEVPHIFLASGVATLERLLSTGIRMYFRQFSQLSQDDVDRAAFFLAIVVNGTMKDYISDPPENLSKELFLGDLAKIAVNYVRSQEWNLAA